MVQVVLSSMVLLAVCIQLKISSAQECPMGVPPRFTSDGEPPAARWVDFGVDGGNFNGDLELPCGVTGTYPISVSWFREGEVNPISQSIATNETDRNALSIAVDETTASRNGTNYYCVATNRIGFGNSTDAAVRSRSVKVSSAFFHNRTAEVATIVGGNVALECAFNVSYPVPDVRWFADDVMITETSGIQFLEGGRYLFIGSLDTAGREMRYHCEISNPQDENGMPIISPTIYSLTRDIPMNTIHPYISQSTMSGRFGEAVQFVFVAAARRMAGTQVVVTVDCLDNNFVTFNELTATIVNGTLTEDGRNEDQVDFICELLSSPPTINVMGTIIVSEAELPSSPANISRSGANSPSLRDLKVDGGNVMLFCEASGSSPLTIWYYNGVEVISGSDGVELSSGNTSLTISAPLVSHSGIYQCFARNLFGEDSRTWTVEVADPVIGMVTFQTTSTFPIMNLGQDCDLVFVPMTTSTLMINATVNSTTIRNVATCNSCPMAEWEKNGVRIVNDTDTCDVDFTGPYTFMVTSEFPPGNYSVMLTRGDVFVTRKLVVTDAADPVITRCTGAEDPVEVGSDLELQCMFLEVLPTSVSWSKDGNDLSNSDDGIMIRRTNGTSTLRITSVTSGGVYTFMTTNEAGSDNEAVTVTVLEPPADNTGLIVGIVVGGGGGVLVLIGSGVILVVVVKKVSKPKDDEEDGGKPRKKESRVYTDPPHATATVAPATATESKEKEAVEMGAMYADPKSIPHETANTGQEYAVSTKKGTKPPQQQVEPPSGDLYSVPDKSKKQKNQDLTYAVVETRPARDQMKGNKQQLQEDSVTYSDIAHPSPL